MNITMQTGDEALAVMRRFHSAAPQRFSTIGWMDWAGHRAAGFRPQQRRLSGALAQNGACGLKMWKDLGLTVRDASGQLLRIDDERLAPIFEKAAELQVPVTFHTADPDAFFLPTDQYNERFEELVIPTGASTDRSTRSRSCCSSATACLRVIRDDLRRGSHGGIGRMPQPGLGAEMLDALSHVSGTLSARVAELGANRTPPGDSMYASRILFGADLLPDVGDVSSQLSLSGDC